MRLRRIGAALTGVVVLVAGFAAPAFSARGDDPDAAKQLEIARLLAADLTPEQEAEEAALLAEEQHRISYESVALPAISPGFGISADGDVLLRVYPAADVGAVEQALALGGLEASVQPTRYSPADMEAIEAALCGISLDEGEGFGFAYDAGTDLVQVSGTVPRAKVEAAVGNRLPYGFEHTLTGGRV